MITKSSSWQEQVRTVSSLISALCLLLITISIVTLGISLIHTVATIQETYHPDKISTMIDDISNVVSTLHKTTLHLGSSQMQPVVSDFHNLIEGIGSLSTSLQQLQVGKMLVESQKWRNMSTHAIIGIAKSLIEL